MTATIISESEHCRRLKIRTLSASQSGKGDVPHTFKNVGDKAGRMIVVVTPAGLEKFFAEIGTPLHSPDADLVEPTPALITRATNLGVEQGVAILFEPVTGCPG